MDTEHRHGPMPYTKAGHLLNPVRNLIISPKILVKRMGLNPDSNVLEIGSGPGYFSPEVARAVSNGKLILVDIQQEMLDMAKKRIDGMGINNIEYLQGDATALPLESETFDAVFMIAVLGEVPDRNACLREINRVLKPNGLFSDTEYKYADPDFIPRKRLRKMVQAAGFLIESQFGIFFHYTVNCRKKD